LTCHITGIRAAFSARIFACRHTAARAIFATGGCAGRAAGRGAIAGAIGGTGRVAVAGAIIGTRGRARRIAVARTIVGAGPGTCEVAVASTIATTNVGTRIETFPRAVAPAPVFASGLARTVAALSAVIRANSCTGKFALSGTGCLTASSTGVRAIVSASGRTAFCAASRAIGARDRTRVRTQAIAGGLRHDAARCTTIVAQDSTVRAPGRRGFLTRHYAARRACLHAASSTIK